MAKFFYTAKTTPTKIIQGEIEAETQLEAVAHLNKIGHIPISISEKNILLEKTIESGS